MRDDPLWSASCFFFFCPFLTEVISSRLVNRFQGCMGTFVCVVSSWKPAVCPLSPPHWYTHAKRSDIVVSGNVKKNLHGTICTSLLIYKTRCLALRMWKDSGASRPWPNQPSGKVILCIGWRLSFYSQESCLKIYPITRKEPLHW